MGNGQRRSSRVRNKRKAPMSQIFYASAVARSSSVSKKTGGPVAKKRKAKKSKKK
jgi:hypothetical protein